MGTEFAIEETGRKPLFSTADTSRPARFIYPLIGISGYLPKIDNQLQEFISSGGNHSRRLMEIYSLIQTF